ncbi:MAG: ABC transporter permease [Bacillota bacterium]
MLRYILKRLGYTVIILLGVSIIVFTILHLAPGSPARILLPQGATDEQVRAKEIEMGLDRPLVEQYLDYLGDLLRGDLGTSYSFNKQNAQLIGERLPLTVKLTLLAVLVSISISIPLGVLGGIKRGSAIDFGAMTFALLGQSMSPVWIGIVLILCFSVWLKWLPSMGPGGLSHMILPAITLGTPMAALVTRMIRAGMIDVMQEDYITAIYARGVSRGKVLFKYALKNVLIPVITIVGIQIGTFLGGAIVTEQVFNLPGIGMLCLQAINNRDFPLVQSLMIVISALFVMVNLLVDIIYTFIDPRIRLEG